MKEYTLVPVEMSGINFIKKIESHIFVHSILLESQSDLFTGAIKIYNFKSEILVNIDSVTIKKVEKKNLKTDSANKNKKTDVFIEQWIKFSERTQESDHRKKEKLLGFIHEWMKTSIEFFEELKKDDCEVILVFPGKYFHKTSDNSYQINPSNKNDYKQLIEDTGKPIECIHLWSTFDNNENRYESFQKIHEYGMKSLLYIIQTYLEMNIKPNFIGVITLKTYNLFKTEEINLKFTPINGLCRSMLLEQPHLNVKQIDIDFLNFELLFKIRKDLIQTIQSDCIIAYRKMERFVPRLNQKTDKKNQEPVRFSNEDIFLIIGAFGGLGWELTEWFIKQGIKKLILLGRKKPNEEKLVKLRKAFN